MTLTGNNFYKISSAFFIAGYAWLLYNITYTGHMHAGICIFKLITHLPCPSCGTTRAVGLLLEGNVGSSLALNPFGIICFTAMLVFPLWLIYDWWYEKKTMPEWYGKMERWVGTKRATLLLFILVTLNWIWNIYKEL